jgi:hypothetical protein
MRVNWQFPARDDLTPDLDYYAVTAQCAVLARFNDWGARGVLLPSPGYAVEKTSIYEFFGNPVGAFTGNDSDVKFADLSWKPLAPERRSQSDRPPAKNDPVEDGSYKYFRGESVKPGARGERTEVHLINLSPPAADGKPEADRVGTDAGRLAALDLKADIKAAQTVWDGERESSYRVLKWQRVDQSQAAPSNTGIRLPRLVVWEDKCTRPRIPNKSYHRIAMMLIDVDPTPVAEFADWERMLPAMRIADLRAGTARMNDTKRDDCVAWDFVKNVSSRSGEFRSLLTATLESTYPEPLKPVSTIAQGPAGAGTAIGAMRHSHEYQLVKTLEGEKPSAPDAPKGAPDAPKGAEPADGPEMLQIMDGIRKATSQQTAKALPDRKGYEAVTDEERGAAQGKLSVLVAGAVGLVGAALLLFFVTNRRGLPHNGREQSLQPVSG